MNPLFLILPIAGIGLALALKGNGNSDEDAEDGDYIDPDDESDPSSNLDNVLADIDLQKVNVVPIIKNLEAIPVVPIQNLNAKKAVAKPLAQAIIEGSNGFEHIYAIDINFTIDPPKVDPTWNLWTWSVARLPKKYEKEGLPAGYYFAIWNMNGEKLVFGGYASLGNPGDKDYPTIKDGIETVLSVPFSTAKANSIGG